MTARTQKLLVRLRTAINITLISTPVCFVLYLLSFLLFYDNSIGYFDPGPLPSLSLACCIAPLLALAVYLLCVGKQQPDDSSFSFPAPGGNPCAWIPAVGLVLFAAYRVYLLIAGGITLFSVLLPVFSLLSAVYFFMVARNLCPSGDLLPLAGFAPLLLCALLTAYTYFDMFVEMNSPQKLYLQFSLVSFMLYVTSELRYPLHKPAPRTTVFFGASTLLIGSAGFICGTVAYLCGILISADYFSQSLLGICFFCYTLVRLITFSRNLARLPETDMGAEAERTEASEEVQS